MNPKGRVRLRGLSNMESRLGVRGGKRQQNRMIDDKVWSLKHAIRYSYQGARVKLIDADLGTRPVPALINPNKLKPNYDDKIISIEHKFGFKAGDVFDWYNTGTKWLIYLQDLTELAYFRAEIRRCRYTINFVDSDGEIKTVYAAVRGPVETAINSIQKQGDSVDNPNFSLDILMPKTQETLDYFKRYSEFYMRGVDEIDKLICWRVTAVDSISMKGIIEVVAKEYYINKDADDLEERVVDGLIMEPIESEPSLIKGPDSIKPKQTATYTYNGKTIKHWDWDRNLPLEVEIGDRTITVKWIKNFSGQFTLKCGDAEKTIIVESLF